VKPPKEKIALERIMEPCLEFLRLERDEITELIRQIEHICAEARKRPYGWSGGPAVKQVKP